MSLPHNWAKAREPKGNVAELEVETCPCRIYIHKQKTQPALAHVSLIDLVKHSLIHTSNTTTIPSLTSPPEINSWLEGKSLQKQMDGSYHCSVAERAVFETNDHMNLFKVTSTHLQSSFSSLTAFQHACYLRAGMVLLCLRGDFLPAHTSTRSNTWPSLTLIPEITVCSPAGGRTGQATSVWCHERLRSPKITHHH